MCISLKRFIYIEVYWEIFRVSFRTCCLPWNTVAFAAEDFVWHLVSILCPGPMNFRCRWQAWTDREYQYKKLVHSVLESSWCGQFARGLVFFYLESQEDSWWVAGINIVPTTAYCAYKHLLPGPGTLWFPKHSAGYWKTRVMARDWTGSSRLCHLHLQWGAMPTM